MKYLALIFGLILFGSCQKVIDVDLNEADPVTVIEANYTAEDSTVRVLINQTSNFFSNEESPTINDAMVMITDQAGNSQQVPFTADGWYVLTNYAPNFESTYTLTVLHDGVTYTASCEMKTPIAQEPIIYDFIEPGIFGDGGYIVAVSYQDPAEAGDYTSVVLSKNGKQLNKLSDLTLNDDLFTNGNPVTRPIFVKFFDLTDTVGIELRTIDQKIYDYYTELASLTDPNSAAPANPTYQWTNRALGYFSAYSSSRQSVIIQ